MCIGIAELFWAVVIAASERELDKPRRILGLVLVAFGTVTFLVGFLSIVFTCISYNVH